MARFYAWVPLRTQGGRTSDTFGHSRDANRDVIRLNLSVYSRAVIPRYPAPSHLGKVFRNRYLSLDLCFRPHS
jgi:hypothetical protein